MVGFLCVSFFVVCLGCGWLELCGHVCRAHFLWFRFLVGCCVAGCVFVCVVVACFAVVFGGDRIVPVIPGGLCAFCVGLCCARLVVLSWLGQWVSACEFMARSAWCRIIRPQACGVQSMASVLALVPPVCGWWDLQLAVGVMFVALVVVVLGCVSFLCHQRMICGFMGGFVFELRVVVFVGLCVRYGGQAGFGPVVVDVCAQRVGQFLVFVCVFGIPVCGWPFVFRLSFAILFGVVCSSGVVRGGDGWVRRGWFRGSVPRVWRSFCVVSK